MRGDQGGTTGDLDREIGEKRGERENDRRARACIDTEAHGKHSPAAQQTRDDWKTEYMNTNVYVYISG